MEQKQRVRHREEAVELIECYPVYYTHLTLQTIRLV